MRHEYETKLCTQMNKKFMLILQIVKFEFNNTKNEFAQDLILEI